MPTRLRLGRLTFGAACAAVGLATGWALAHGARRGDSDPTAVVRPSPGEVPRGDKVQADRAAQVANTVEPIIAVPSLARVLTVETPDRAEALLATFLDALGSERVRGRGAGRATVVAAGAFDPQTSDLRWRTEDDRLRIVGFPSDPQNDLYWTSRLIGALQAWFVVGGILQVERLPPGQVRVTCAATWGQLVTACFDECKERGIVLEQEEAHQDAHVLTSKDTSGRWTWGVFISVLGKHTCEIGVCDYVDPFAGDREQELLKAILDRAAHSDVYIATDYDDGVIEVK